MAKVLAELELMFMASQLRGEGVSVMSWQADRNLQVILGVTEPGVAENCVGAAE